MSHTYNIECSWCNDEFCDCHPWVYIEEQKDMHIFCTTSCAEQFKEEYPEFKDCEVKESQ